MSDCDIELMRTDTLDDIEDVGGIAQFVSTLRPTDDGEPHRILLGSRYGDLEVDQLVRALNHAHLSAVLEDEFGEPHRLLLGNIDGELVSLTDDEWFLEANNGCLPDWLHESLLEEAAEMERGDR